MKNIPTLSRGTPQRKKLEALIHEIKTYQPMFDIEDTKSLYEQGLTVSGWLAQFQLLAGPILPDEYASSLKAIAFDEKSLSSAFEVKGSLEALASIVEHALEAIDNEYGPAANADLPEHIQKDYEEAKSILHLSPRGAAALLRLCVQQICISLGEPGQNLNKDIGSLVKNGLSIEVQRALDIVRVIGNNAVHPGALDLKDDKETVKSLLLLVNLIADSLISLPKRVGEMYDSLPQGAIEAIENRDKQ